jgi:hypothetical protein
MEPSKRNELTDILYAEVAQKLEALEKTLTAQGITRNGNPHTPQGPPSRWSSTLCWRSVSGGRRRTRAWRMPAPR